MSKVLLHIDDMTIGHEGRRLYSDVSLEVCEGECIMLCGANGSGKTTLLKAIVNLRDDICMIPSRIPRVKGFTLMEFVRISCFDRSDLGGRLMPEQEYALVKAMQRLELSHLAQRDISTLSDGEFQKGCVAAALARRSAVMLLDEPTAFLDAENRLSVLNCLKDISNAPDADGRRPAVIFSTHDLHDGLKVADKVFALGADGVFRQSSGNIVETVSTIFETFYNFGVHFHDYGKETIPD